MEGQLEGSAGFGEFNGSGLKVEAGRQFEFGEGDGIEASEGGNGGVHLRVLVFASVDEPPAAREIEGKAAFREGGSGGGSGGEGPWGREGRGADSKSVGYQSSPSWGLVYRLSEGEGRY